MPQVVTYELRSSIVLGTAYIAATRPVIAAICAALPVAAALAQSNENSAAEQRGAQGRGVETPDLIPTYNETIAGSQIDRRRLSMRSEGLKTFGPLEEEPETSSGARNGSR